mmetsp:Transcript_83431/g.234610  ORF Transcript_83431/g.234610 Transcript_83431/m.234610 type:complete len:633 (+) Transcript_83431:104-2002(+)
MLRGKAPAPIMEVTMRPKASQEPAPRLEVGQEETFRAHAPWVPSTHSCSAMHGTGQAQAKWTHGLHDSVSRGAICQPSGWPAAHGVEGLFDQHPEGAKRFEVWDKEDGANWVNGELADGYLRKLMLKGDPVTTAMKVARPQSPTDHSRNADRRLCCSVGHGPGDNNGCLCLMYDPSLTLPLTLADKIEINNDIRPTAMRIIEESNIGASLRRAGVERGDVELDYIEKPAIRDIPKSHRLRFRVRQERREWLQESAGYYLWKSVEEQLELTEYEINFRMLPDLKKWLDKFRAIKIQRLRDVARKFQEEVNGDAEWLASQTKGGTGESAQPKGWQDPEVAAMLAARLGPHKPLLLCRCGHAEVWHAKPPCFQDAIGPFGASMVFGSASGSRPLSLSAERHAATPTSPTRSPGSRSSPVSRSSPLSPVSLASSSMRSTGAWAGTGAYPKVAPLRPLGPETLMKGLPVIEVFLMIADTGKPKPPTRVRSEPSISGGRLVLAGASTLLSSSGAKLPPPAAGASAPAAAAGSMPAASSSVTERQPKTPKQKEAKPMTPSAPSHPPPRSPGPAAGGSSPVSPAGASKSPLGSTMSSTTEAVKPKMPTAPSHPPPRSGGGRSPGAGGSSPAGSSPGGSKP